MKEVKTQFHTFPNTGPFQYTLRDEPVTLAYETYGELSAGRDNVILLFHALSGSQHAAGWNPDVPGVEARWTKECRTGWWDEFIGPGKALDTDQFYILCVNYLGGCYGSSGPASIHPATGTPYGSAFPRITAGDIVDAQVALLNHLRIEKLHAVVGASLGGMLAVNLAVRYPNRVRTVIPIAAGLEVTILQRIHNFEQICAIEEDPHFNGGDYYHVARPDSGLALARMISHKTFLSLSVMEQRARDDIIERNPDPKRYQMSHPVESYMLHQSQKFVRRFDANSYLRIMELWQHYDLLKDTGAADYAALFAPCAQQRYLIFSIDSDVCFYPEEQADMARVIQENHIPCQHITVHSGKGHDAFLLEPELFTPHLVYTLQEKW
ncbi:MAG: homoserine O-acetyltransferase [Spartobacteria bacterium]|nr:homoserine O-acetyltransferase [Spartobacteria bacterium]